MGWNDHVDYYVTRCKDCGAEDDWEYWDEVGIARYIGELGIMLNVDPGRHNKCPRCGSSNGEIVDELRDDGDAEDDINRL